MSYTPEQVREALSKVVYKPLAKDIVSAGMVKDITIDGNKVGFTLVFRSESDPHITSVRQECIKNMLIHVDALVDLRDNIKVEYSDEVGGHNLLSGVKNIIAIASGKGGVGKSTVAANLAVALALEGARTGLIDADVYGPSIPLMFGLTEAKPLLEQRDGKSVIIPVEKYGISILSIGFFVDPSQALIWRGPMASSALTQLFRDTAWGALDYLIIDLPPGTGDIHLTVVQQLAITGVAIVTTPQEVALADARKAFAMFRQEQINVPILGLIENMSWFTPAELPENKYYIFGKEGGKKLAEEYNISLLGQIPLVQGIAESGDSGRPVALDADSPVGEAFRVLARNVIQQLEKRNAELPPTEMVKMSS